MPKVDLCFQGWIRGASVDTATNAAGEEVDVSGMTSEELAEKLANGELFISLGKFLYERREDASIEMFDFDATKE